MKSGMLKFVGAYFGVMAGSVLVLLLVAAMVPDKDRVAQWVFWGIGPWAALMAYSFFLFQDRFLGLPGDASVEALGKQALAEEIRRLYSAPENREVFEVFEQGDTMAVSWAAGVRYNQLVAAGGVSLKRVYVLRLDDAHKVARVVVKEKDARWSASAGGLDFSFNYMLGYSVDFQIELAPSIEVSPDGRLRFDVTKLRYDSEEVWGPLQRLVTGAGWRVQVDMLPVRWMRWAFIAGIALLLLPLAFVDVRRPAGGRSAAPAAAATALTPDETLAAIRRSVGKLPTAALGSSLQEIMRVPVEHLHPFVREEFRIYADAYSGRGDGDPAVSASVRRYRALLTER